MTSATTEEAKRIEELILSGKTWREIAEEMELSRAQIKYRLTTRYAENVCKNLLKTLNANEKKRQQEELVAKKSKSLVLDTCAVKAGNFFTILNLYEKVYILGGVLSELENLKEKGSRREKRNIKDLMNEVLDDKTSEKYVLVLEEHVDSYQDNNILNFCIQHKEEGIVLYTDDHPFAMRAKLYGIEYEMANEEAREDRSVKEKIAAKVTKTAKSESKKEKPVKTTSKKEKPVTLTAEDLEELKNAMQGNSLEQEVIAFSDEGLINLAGASWVGNTLILHAKDESETDFYVVEREQKVKEPISGLVTLKEGDIVYYSQYNKRYNNIQVNRYVIVKNQPEHYAMAHEWRRANTIEEVNRLPYSKLIIKKIEMHFKMHKK